MAALVRNEKKLHLKERLTHTGKNILLNKEKYFLILPGVVWYAIFAYIPIFGLSLAFKKFIAKTAYSAARG